MKKNYFTIFVCLYLSLSIFLQPCTFASNELSCLLAPDSNTDDPDFQALYQATIRTRAALNEGIDFIRRLGEATANYLNRFQYRTPDGESLKFPFNEQVYLTILEIIAEFIEEQMAGTPNARLQEVISNRAIIAKLMLAYQHAPFLGKVTEEDKKKFIKDIISRYVSPDKVTAFIETHLAEKTELIHDSKLFARANVVYEAYKEQPTTTLKEKLQALADGKIDDQKIRRLLQYLRKNSYPRSSFSVFFNPKDASQDIADPATMCIFDYINWAYQTGLSGLEIATDFLPFDPSKRLPEEFSHLERQQIKALVELFGLNLTVHSPLVGPFQGPKSLFTDPADNVELYAETIQFCHDIGARSVVVHIVERGRIEEMAQILVTAANTDVKVAFENSYNKNGVFPTADEVAEIIKKVAARTHEIDPPALKNLAITFDSAHYNLVPNMEDPLVAFIKLADLASKLEKEYEHFDYRRFFAELHLNQNLGAISYFIGFSADLHSSIETPGPINNAALISFAFAQGFNPIVIAEQRETISPAGLKFIEEAVIAGQRAIGIYKLLEAGLTLGTALAEQNAYKPFFNGKNRKIAYAMLSGLYGLSTLTQQLENRINQQILTGQGTLEGRSGLATRIIPAGEEFITEGEFADEMYIIARGTAGIYKGGRPFLDGEDKQITRKAGEFVGEIALVKGIRRTNTVKAKTEMLVTVISAATYRLLIKLYPDFLELVTTHAEQRLFSEVNLVKAYILNEIEPGQTITVRQLKTAIQTPSQVVKKALAELMEEQPGILEPAPGKPDTYIKTKPITAEALSPAEELEPTSTSV